MCGPSFRRSYYRVKKRCVPMQRRFFVGSLHIGRCFCQVEMTPMGWGTRMMCWAHGKMNHPFLFVFWHGQDVASMTLYSPYETIVAPCLRTRARRNLRSIYFFRGPAVAVQSMTSPSASIHMKSIGSALQSLHGASLRVIGPGGIYL